MSESLNSYSNGSINAFAELGAFIEAQNEFRKLLHTKDLIVWSEGSRVSLEAVVLTKREKSVRSLLIAGRSSAEIANTLGISKKTVEKHIERIYHKYDVTSFCEFVATYRF